MGLPAARMLDIAGHGGMILIGAPTVLINGMLAARVGDPLMCPGFDGPKPHVLGNIIMGSTTVKIAGAFAARMGDSTGCGVAGVSGTSMPAVAGPPVPAIPGSAPTQEGAVYGDKNAGALYGKKDSYSNDKGSGVESKGSLGHAEGETKVGGLTLSGSADVGTVSGEAHAGYGGAGAGASGSAVTLQGKAADDHGNSVAVTGKGPNAGANASVLVGSDGRRTGIGMTAGATASIAEVQADSSYTIPIPFTNKNIKWGGTAGYGSGVGAAGTAGAFHDSADDRHHLVGGLEAKLLLGFKLGLDVSIGKKDAPASPLPPPVSTPGIGVPMTPGVIMIGSPTVLIG